jgi:hypothetical protein
MHHFEYLDCSFQDLEPELHPLFYHDHPGAVWTPYRGLIP